MTITVLDFSEEVYFKTAFAQLSSLIVFPNVFVTITVFLRSFTLLKDLFRPVYFMIVQ